MAKDRSVRYHSAEAFVRDLQQAFGIHYSTFEQWESMLAADRPRDDSVPPHLLGRDRHDSFGRTGRTIAGYFEQYFRSQVEDRSDRPSIDNVVPAVATVSSDASKWEKMLGFRSQSVFSVRSTFMNWMLFLGLSACVYPIATAFMQTDDSYEAVASTQHMMTETSQAYGDLKSAFSPRLVAAANSGYFAHSVGSSSGGQPTNWEEEAVRTPSARSAHLMAKISSFDPADVTPAMEEVVLRLLKHSDFGVRVASIKRLDTFRHVKQSRIVARLAEIVDDPDNIIRAHVCRALAKAGTVEAIELLRAQQAIERDTLVLRVIHYSLQKAQGAAI
jgi:hypothetical protein